MKGFFTASLTLFISALVISITLFALMTQSQINYDATKSELIQSLEDVQTANDDLERMSNFALECIAKNYRVFGCMGGPSALPDLNKQQSVVKDAEDWAEHCREKTLAAIGEVETLRMLSIASLILAALAMVSSIFFFRNNEFVFYRNQKSVLKARAK